jgi:hypothetical protein
VRNGRTSVAEQKHYTIFPGAAQASGRALAGFFKFVQNALTSPRKKQRFADAPERVLSAQSFVWTMPRGCAILNSG